MRTYTTGAFRTYAVLAVVAAIAALALSFGPSSHAQSAAVSCSVNTPTVAAGQPATFSATGGDGTYLWTGPNLNITNAHGSQFVVSYPRAGVYPITVQSNGVIATCNLTVTGGTATNPPITPGLPNTGGGFGR